MGLHDVCRNLHHHFDRDKDLYADRIERNGNRDIIYWGICEECGTLRMVYESELKNRKVIKAKITGKKY